MFAANASVATETAQRIAADNVLQHYERSHHPSQRGYGVDQQFGKRSRYKDYTVQHIEHWLAATNAALGNETSSRIAGDAALGTRIDNLALSVDSRFHSLDRQISSSTAIATALSGESFLSGKKFNLTANVGTYGGAYAGALQFGVMVSESAAINAGVAKGFNRDGKTAARARITLGF